MRQKHLIKNTEPYKKPLCGTRIKIKKIRFNGLYGWEGRCISYLTVLLPLTGVVDPDKKLLAILIQTGDGLKLKHLYFCFVKIQ